MVDKFNIDQNVITEPPDATDGQYMDAIVIRGNLKNLVTDKPAPITVALEQKIAETRNASRLFRSICRRLLKKEMKLLNRVLQRTIR